MKFSIRWTETYEAEVEAESADDALAQIPMHPDEGRAIGGEWTGEIEAI